LSDRYHGSAYPCVEPESAPRVHKPTSPPLPYRGCSPAYRRLGTARTAPASILRATGHRRGITVVSAVHLELGDRPWAGIPCWSGRAKRWLQVAVPTAYLLHYDTRVRPAMPNNPVSLKTLLRVAEARSHFADHRTGRNCRPTNATLATATGLSIRTVQRASTALRLLGVATEVLRGRQRSRHERFASWRLGDRGRGWASVWVLHDSRFRSLSPHPEGSSFKSLTSVSEKLTTRKRRQAGRDSDAARRRNPDNKGLLLAQRWITHRDSPSWARRYRTAQAWAAVLTRPAHHHWTPHDLNRLISDYMALGNWVPDSPHKPVGLLGAILKWHSNLDERPGAIDEAREAEYLATERARIAAQAAESAALRAARETGRAAVHGPGHNAARQALTDALAARRRVHRSRQGQR
jgi:hypothetical protein